MDVTQITESELKHQAFLQRFQKTYDKITNTKRLRLLKLVEEENVNVYDAAAQLNIKVTTAKSLLQLYKKRGSILRLFREKKPPVFKIAKSCKLEGNCLKNKHVRARMRRGGTQNLHIHEIEDASKDSSDYEEDEEISRAIQNSKSIENNTNTLHQKDVPAKYGALESSQNLNYLEDTGVTTLLEDNIKVTLEKLEINKSMSKYFDARTHQILDDISKLQETYKNLSREVVYINNAATGVYQLIVDILSSSAGKSN